MSAAQFADIVHSDPEIQGGTPVFCGTRVPAESLFQPLEGGETIEDFLAGFPSVQREQGKKILRVCRFEVGSIRAG